MADSLGPAYFEKIKQKFNRTPFRSTSSKNKWMFIQGPQQHAASNDCAIFMLIVFSSYLLFTCENPKDSIIKMFTLNNSSYQFGISGRADIYKSIIKKEIQYDCKSINCIKYHLADSYELTEEVII